MWGAPQKVGKWICFKSSCLGWGDGEAADVLSGILPSLQEHLELKAILPGKWAACSFLWPAAFSRVSLQVTHTRIAMLTRGASNSRYNTTTQKLKDLPQDPVSSRLRTGLSLWMNLAGLAHDPSAFHSLKVCQRGRSAITPGCSQQRTQGPPATSQEILFVFFVPHLSLLLLAWHSPCAFPDELKNHCFSSVWSGLLLDTQCDFCSEKEEKDAGKDPGKGQQQGHQEMTGS